MAIALLLLSFTSAIFGGWAAYVQTESILAAVLGYSWGGAAMLMAVFLIALFRDRAENDGDAYAA